MRTGAGGGASVKVMGALLALGAIASVVVLALSRLHPPAPADNRGTAARKKAPDLAMVDLAGRAWKLREHRGRVVLVNYWASWCPPCVTEVPALVRLSNEYRVKGLEVVGVAVDEEGLDGVRRFVERHNVTYPVLVPGTGSSMVRPIAMLPSTFLVDRDGRLAAFYQGAVDEALLRRGVEELLGEPWPGPGPEGGGLENARPVSPGSS